MSSVTDVYYETQGLILHPVFPTHLNLKVQVLFKKLSAPLYLSSQHAVNRIPANALLQTS